MTRILIGTIVLMLTISCKNTSENDVIEVYNYSELAPLLKSTSIEKTYVVNFWATWCAPCIKELPYFEELHTSNKNVEVILVSLDFPEKFESQLIPFVAQKNLTPQVILLDDPDENTWIPAIDSTWSGALPATLIFNKGKRAFYEQSFTKESLFFEVEKFTKI